MLPLAAGINVGGHSSSLLILPEGVVVGILILHGLLNKNNTNSGKKKSLPRGARGLGSEYFFLPEFLFLLVRSPYKI